MNDPTPLELLKMLRSCSGRIVSTGDLTEPAIAVARASGRMFVDDEGFGYVFLPGVDKNMDDLQ